MTARSTRTDEAELVGKLSATQLSQLERNRLHKRHWRSEDVSRDFLLRRLREEVEELAEYPSWEEAADVANFAAMIADVANGGYFPVESAEAKETP